MRDQFRVAGIDTAELDARLLAERAFGIHGLELVAREREQAAADGTAALAGFAERRLRGEPVARILGEKEFYGLRFGLVPAALVPRRETEMLVDFGLGQVRQDRPSRILDLGTGTGCIAIASLAHLPAASGVAIDISAEAAACAEDNARRNAVAERLEVRTGSWFEPLAPDERFDLLLANPPYIESAVIAELSPEVREHDPRLALDGGPDGLAPYREIVAGAAAHLRPGGALAMEIGSTQGGAVARLLGSAGFSKVSVKKDLAGLDRMAVAHQV